jgi:hypothetical protein
MLYGPIIHVDYKNVNNIIPDQTKSDYFTIECACAFILGANNEENSFDFFGS